MSERGRQSAVTVAAILTLAAAIGGCRPPDAGEAEALRVGILPDQEERELRSVYEPLLAYLSEATSLELELTLTGSYGELVRRFGADDIQLAWFGGFTFIQAARSKQAEPLVMRDVDLEFTSDFLVATSAPGRSVEDFVGKRLGLGPRLSTSGNLMPRYFLRQLGLDPASAFSEVRNSSGHDQTAAWVRDGVVDVGAVNTQVATTMFRQDRLSASEVRVLWRTPPYRNYVWAVDSELDPAVKNNLRDAFLALEITVPEHAAILSAQGASGYIPASSRDYEDLRRAAESLSEALE